MNSMMVYYTCMLLFGSLGIISGNKALQPPKFSNDHDCKVGLSYNVRALRNQNFATIKLPDIQVTDECGIEPKIECMETSNNNRPCQYEFGKEYQFQGGDKKFVIRATGSTGYSDCTFNVHVSSGDTEKPKLLYCPSSKTVESTSRYATITWNQPRYHDNVDGDRVTVTSNYPSGMRLLVPSQATVMYGARDSSGNRNEECKFTVTAKKKPLRCKIPTPMDNGAYVTDADGKTLIPLCRYGSTLSPIPLLLFTCDGDNWKGAGYDYTLSQMKCTRGGIPLFSYFTDCQNEIQKIKTNVAVIFGHYQTHTLKVSCGRQTNNWWGRKK